MKPDQPTDAAELRRRAHARLQTQKPPANAPRSAHETQRLLHELQVIAITASGEASADPEGRSQFSGFIRKPFSRHTLFIALAPFLQRAAQKDAMAPVSSAETAANMPRPTPERAAQWRELTLKLRHQEADEWPSLRDSLAINGTRAFAPKLLDLAQAAQCRPLASYAATLTTFADGYAIGQMERHLAAFPKLVESIETSSAQPDLKPV